jgi:hypothetical protein
MRVIDRRAVVARQIEEMRADDAAVHESLLSTTGLGVTYDRIAELMSVSVQDVVMWSAGAGIPTKVSDKRRILAACVQSLQAPLTTNHRLSGRRTATPTTLKAQPLRIVRKAPLCCVCMTNISTDDTRDICGRANCYRRYEEQRRIAAMHGG